MATGDDGLKATRSRQAFPSFDLVAPPPAFRVSLNPHPSLFYSVRCAGSSFQAFTSYHGRSFITQCRCRPPPCAPPAMSVLRAGIRRPIRVTKTMFLLTRPGLFLPVCGSVCTERGAESTAGGVASLKTTNICNHFNPWCGGVGLFHRYAFRFFTGCLSMSIGLILPR